MPDVFDKALLWAATAHQGQEDKAGRPYLMHICEVICGVPTNDEKTVAALHDIVEDTTTSFSDLEYEFPEYIIEAVRALTKTDGEDYLNDFIPRCAKNPLARVVKLADLRHNSDLSRLKILSEADYRRNIKYGEAIRLLEAAS